MEPVPKKCAIESCDRQKQASVFCSKHYQNYRYVNKKFCWNIDRYIWWKNKHDKWEDHLQFCAEVGMDTIDPPKLFDDEE